MYCIQDLRRDDGIDEVVALHSFQFSSGLFALRCGAHSILLSFAKKKNQIKFYSSPNNDFFVVVEKKSLFTNSHCA